MPRVDNNAHDSIISVVPIQRLVFLHLPLVTDKTAFRAQPRIVSERLGGVPESPAESPTEPDGSLDSFRFDIDNGARNDNETTASDTKV